MEQGWRKAERTMDGLCIDCGFNKTLGRARAGMITFKLVGDGTVPFKAVPLTPLTALKSKDTQYLAYTTNCRGARLGSFAWIDSRSIESIQGKTIHVTVCT